MSNEHLAKLYTTQMSLTEWLASIKHKDLAVLSNEDNEKRERLKTLEKVINLPFDKPTQFTAEQLHDGHPEVEQYIAEHGQELCAIRLIPTKEKLPKLRTRGKTVAEAYEWFKQQPIQYGNYRVDFVPHDENSTWATIFIVNQHGIFGEIITGGHHQLTQGFHETDKPTTFSYDFTHWSTSPQNTKAEKYLATLVQLIHVKDKHRQHDLTESLGSTFSHNYLEGYFETTDSEEFGVWYKDYSPTLGSMYNDLRFTAASPKNDTLLKGQVGSKGVAKGNVVIVPPDKIDITFPKGSVLVCKVTTPNYVPLMQKASAIITDQGGILSHAAIVARELKVPCIVGTKNATKLLKNGQLVTVDGDSGTVVPA